MNVQSRVRTSNPFRLILLAGSALAACTLVTAAQPEVKPQVKQEDKQDTAANVKPEVKPDGKADPKAWNVSEVRGPTVAAKLDVTSGTWLSLDVSPDGSTIVFDMLGDLYSLPISGGDATNITRGIEWDMQPAFSPSGDRIAFTSDRGGGDNIWTIKPDGTDAKQVSKESFRLINSPAWLPPQGDYVVGAKHFTSRRSLGASEMWLFHAATGGDGLQMTTRPTEQKGVGEPAFSPDGRYLYYSWDSTPGGTFEYNKDSTQGIYSINRLDRTTGEEETIISGPGGACRPTPSPDGNWLAYVKRVRFETVLFVRDLRSGQERPVIGGLERDMQESWAIHGVYPRMAWMPDGKSIVLYAQGGFKRIEVESGKSTSIPFRVRDERTMQSPVRFPVEVAPDEFSVKMPRNVVVRPDGKQVAYNALGYIYVRDLPDGTPRRLTTQNEHFEYPGGYSRDGTSLVYTTWSDTELGSVRLINSGGGEARLLTREKGHYVDPAIAPDGKTVVFGKVSGGYLVSPLWSSKPGLYKVAVDGKQDAGGEPILITKRGTNPQFGAESDRVYLMTVESRKDNDRRALISISLDGKEERTHYTSENATEFRVSPDGTHLAFSERYNVYITPLTATGREVAISPKLSSQPLAKVSADGSVNLNWSGDSQSLYWTLGPSLYQRGLKESFTFLAGVDSADKLPPPPAAGVALGFSAKADKPQGTVVLQGATLLTMTRTPARAATGGVTDPATNVTSSVIPAVRTQDVIIEDGVVIITDNRISAVGKKGEVTIPAGAEIVDCTGMFIMPGIIDVHAHGAQGANGFTPQQNWINLANLAYGVTTIHDPSNDTESIFAASELARSGQLLAPRIFSTGTILYGAAGSFKAEVENLDDATFHLRRLKAVGAFSVKSYNQPRRDQRQQVIAGARTLGMMVVPEGGSTFQHNMTMLVDGHTGIEHTLSVEKIYDDVKQLWSYTTAGYTPTLLVGYGGLDGEHYWYDRQDVWENEKLLQFVPKFLVDPMSRRRAKAPDSDYNVLRLADICKAVIDAGATTHVGAHGQLAGLGAHWELWLLTSPGAEGGLSASEALYAATMGGAKYLGLDGDIGSIEVGKLADLIVLERNPVDDVFNTQTLRYTVSNGRVFTSKDLAQVWPQRKSGPIPWFTEVDRALPTGMMMARFAAGCAGCARPGGHDHNETREGYR